MHRTLYLYYIFFYLPPGGQKLMNKMLHSLFSSPDKLLQVMSHGEMQDAIEEGDRIIVDTDGNTSVNVHCPQVQEDFKQHVEALKRA